MSSSIEANKFLELIVTDADAGRRLDNFLYVHLKRLPRSLRYKLIRSGRIRVNAKKCQPQARLEAGWAVRVPQHFIPTTNGGTESFPQRTNHATSHWDRPPLNDTYINGLIFEEHTDYLVINKPSGLAVHKGTNQAWGLIEQLRATRKDLAYLELGHRLDKDTSGCLLIFKNLHALKAFQKTLKEGTVQKIYIALVQGNWSESRVKVHAPLPTTPHTHAAARGKLSETKVTKLLQTPLGSLMLLRPITGRTHQLRIQMATSNNPIAGDRRYGDYSYNTQMHKVGMKRLYLHCTAISAPKANTRENTPFSASKELSSQLLTTPFPADLQKCTGLKECIEHEINKLSAEKTSSKSPLNPDASIKDVLYWLRYINQEFT